MLGLGAGIVLPAVVGCGIGTAEGDATRPVGRVIRSRFAAPVLVDGKFERSGTVTAMVGEGEPHELHVSISSAITRGEDDTAITIQDLTAGTGVQFALNDENSTALVETDAGVSTIQFNADETMTVGNMTLSDEAEVAEAVFTSSASSDVTPESLVAASTAIEEMAPESAATSRGFIGRLVKSAVKKILKIGVCVTYNSRQGVSVGAGGDCR
jgi:hypothetical protein